jgi:hypothetical protein
MYRVSFIDIAACWAALWRQMYPPYYFLNCETKCNTMMTGRGD